MSRLRAYLTNKALIDGNWYLRRGNFTNSFDGKRGPFFLKSRETQFIRYGMPDDFSKQGRSCVPRHPPLLSC